MSLEEFYKEYIKKTIEEMDKEFLYKLYILIKRHFDNMKKL